MSKYDKVCMTECRLMHWCSVVINSLSYCADWCTVIEAYYRLTHCPNNRTGWLILSNPAYPVAYLCFNQSEWVTCLYLLIVLMSQASCEVSHDHVMQIVRNKCKEIRASVTLWDSTVFYPIITSQVIVSKYNTTVYTVLTITCKKGGVCGTSQVLSHSHVQENQNELVLISSVTPIVQLKCPHIIGQESHY